LRSSARRYCSHACWYASEELAALRAARRKVERPPHDELVAALATASYAAVGRRHGVSATTIYRWLRRGAAERASPASAPASRLSVETAPDDAA
jgi:transposase-like protein